VEKYLKFSLVIFGKYKPFLNYPKLHQYAGFYVCKFPIFAAVFDTVNHHIFITHDIYLLNVIASFYKNLGRVRIRGS